MEKAMQKQIEKNRFTLHNEVEYDGIIYLVEDYRFDEVSGKWVYDLKELEGDGERIDIPQDDIKMYIESIPDFIIVDYRINGKNRTYIYNLKELNDCDHYFDDEDKIVRTLVKRDKGLGEEDYFEELPINEVTKMVLAAKQKLA